MTILVTGSNGQLGRSLVARGAVGCARDQLDLRNPDQIERVLDQLTPSTVINAAAYTAVDKAQSDHLTALAVNADGARSLARACARRRIRLLHISSDYVFGGDASQPYQEDDDIDPRSVYAYTKAAGEFAVHGEGGTVVRTSWLFAERGPSFVHAIARRALEQPLLRVVSDQWGCPTYAGDLADALLVLAARDDLDSTYHYCNEGRTTWHAFATVIVEILRRVRPVVCERVTAITTDEYPTAAPRPAYSVLDTARVRAIGIVPPSWIPGLESVLASDFGRDLATGDP